MPSPFYVARLRLNRGSESQRHGTIPRSRSPLASPQDLHALQRTQRSPCYTLQKVQLQGTTS